MHGETRITIGALARLTGLPVRTLRFYSDSGLVAPAGRSEAGYRLYDRGAAARVDLVRTAMPELPDDPATEQVEAWIELAELVRDDDVRARIRAMAQRASADRAEGGAGVAGREAHERAAAAVAKLAGGALADGIEPASARARPVVDELAAVFAQLHGREDGPEFRAWLGGTIDAFTDRRAERYWELLAIINGWPQRPSSISAWEWLPAGLRA